ncbi:MAG: histidinol-phosphate transaminase [Bdellovibrio sp.]|nr:histidinol-phosphate transaminase [Bdellovibrio sp.]
MMIQVPEYIRSLVPYLPGKPIEETQREFRLKRVIKLASNENPLGPSPKAKLAIKKAIQSLHRYPDGSGFHLKQALAFHLGVQSSQIILGNGSNEVIDILVRTYCLPGDAVITHRGAFQCYKICSQIHGVNTIELEVDQNFQWNVDELLFHAQTHEDVKIIFLANPNNPTGTYFSASVLNQLTEGLSRIRGGSIILALDYAYWEYVRAKDLPDPAKALSLYPNTIIFRTFSKIYGLAGLRVGYGVASQEVIFNMEKVRQPFNVSSVALVGAEASLRDTTFVKKSRLLNATGLKFWEKTLTRLGIPFWPSQGNFILADVAKAIGRSGPEVFHECLKKGVIFRPIANYGYPDALRISVGTNEENLIAAKALSGLMPGRKKR